MQNGTEYLERIMNVQINGEVIYLDFTLNRNKKLPVYFMTVVQRTIKIYANLYNDH